ncbi:hypothetical protein BLNAU_24052 [Blattamonas nauphoetae]|uniref:Uncharacterized protein n=1 Tax=Blattamonas nauphoetae TaxID=2049346 RepID=A0ABQ9WNX0_9EUKA|nr:hypothetical protein BLNAU_24052 [Blattamonas nauphoetae]
MDQKSHFPTESGKTVNLSSNVLSILADRHKIWHFQWIVIWSVRRVCLTPILGELPLSDICGYYFDVCGSMPGVVRQRVLLIDRPLCVWFLPHWLHPTVCTRA